MSQSDRPTYMKLTDTADSFRAGGSTARARGEAFRIDGQSRPVDLATAYRASRVAAGSARGLSIMASQTASIALPRRAA